MSGDPTVTATITSTPGRFLVSARQVHFVADASASRGGKGEAVLAAELLLASLATCGLALVTDAARVRASTLAGAEIETSYTVDPEDKTRFSVLALRFRLAGVQRREAEELVRAFTDTCPIYNTIARTTRTEIVVKTI